MKINALTSAPTASALATQFTAAARGITSAVTSYEAVQNAGGGEGWGEWAQANLEEIAYGMDHARTRFASAVAGLEQLRPSATTLIGKLRADISALDSAYTYIDEDSIAGLERDLRSELRSAVADARAAARLLRG